VHDEERVHDAEEVVRVPEGVEPGEPVQRRGQPGGDGGRTGALAERVRGQREGHGHQHHHGHAGEARSPGQERRVRRLEGAERARHQRVVLWTRRDHPREVARQVVPDVQRDPHHDRRRDHLPRESIGSPPCLPDYDETTPPTVTGCACPGYKTVPARLLSTRTHPPSLTPAGLNLLH
jgi:hypothetical protein